MNIARNKFFNKLINNFNMEIIDSGYVNGDKRWKDKNVVSPFSRIYLIESGEAAIKANGKTIIMHPGNAYLIPTGLNFSWKCEESYTKLFFHFTFNKLNGYDIFADLREFHIIPLNMDIIKKLIESYNSTDSCDILFIKAKLYDILSNIIPSEKLEINSSVSYSGITRETIRYITSNLNLHRLSLKSISEHLHISETTLTKKFKDDVGINIKKYINDQIFYESEKMLLKTNWPISKISTSLGFYDQFYFSKSFKKRFGITPSDYRKKYNMIF